MAEEQDCDSSRRPAETRVCQRYWAENWMMLMTNDDFNNKGPLVKLTGNLDPGLLVLKGLEHER